MANVAEQKCPSCGGALRFDPDKGMLVCDHCSAGIDINASEAPADAGVSGLDYGAMTAQATDDTAQALPIYNCMSCGAEVIAPAEQFATTCPYCGNNIVLTDKVSGKLRPNGLIPFRIDKARLPETMKAFYKDKVLLPKDFFTQSAMSRVTGVYVPFWMFSGRLAGPLYFRVNTSTSFRQGDYIVTKNDHYQVRQDVDVSFADVPVDASGRIDDRLTDSLEPFDMNDVKPFDMRYLAGFTADRFDLAKDEVLPRAQSRMSATAQAAAIGSLRSKYSGITRNGGSLQAELSARYLLLPMYLFSIAYHGKNYEFAVNGQTGKVVGEVPISKGLSWKYFLIRAGIVAGIVAAIFIVKYFLGR